jgi:hypothetical protein
MAERRAGYKMRALGSISVPIVTKNRATKAF